MGSRSKRRNDPTIGVTARTPGQTATFLPEPEVEELFCPIISSTTISSSRSISST